MHNLSIGALQKAANSTVCIFSQYLYNLASIFIHQVRQVIRSNRKTSLGYKHTYCL